MLRTCPNQYADSASGQVHSITRDLAIPIPVTQVLPVGQVLPVRVADVLSFPFPPDQDILFGQVFPCSWSNPFRW